jgi:hypothetical protein
LDKVADEESTYWFPKVWPTRPNDMQERLQAIVPQVEAAKKKLEIVQSKLFEEVAVVKAATAESI